MTGPRADSETERAEGVPLEPEVKASLAILAAHYLLHEIDPPGLEVLRQDDVLEVLEKLEPGCREYLAARSWSPDDFDAAAAEYCRLFILPGGASPYAAAWLGGDPLVAGPRIAARIEEAIRALGEDPQVPSPRDHLGVLLTLTARAWQAGTAGEPLARELVEELLLPWMPAFSQALRQKTEHPFYRALGSLLSQLSRSLETPNPAEEGFASEAHSKD